MFINFSLSGVTTESNYYLRRGDTVINMFRHMVVQMSIWYSYGISGDSRKSNMNEVLGFYYSLQHFKIGLIVPWDKKFKATCENRTHSVWSSSLAR